MEDTKTTHYTRLIGVGFDPKDARRMAGYDEKEGSSVTTASPLEVERPPAVSPEIHQKIIAKNDFGMVTYTGDRFTTIHWVKTGKKERVSNMRVQQAIKDHAYVLVPQIRMSETK